MVNKKNEQRFVCLIKRKNGRIVKNEAYDLEQFSKIVFDQYEEIEYSWYDKMFKTETYTLYLENQMYERAKHLLLTTMLMLIEFDVEGKGTSDKIKKKKSKK